MISGAKIAMWTATNVQDTGQPRVKKKQYLASQGDFPVDKDGPLMLLKTIS